MADETPDEPLDDGTPKADTQRHQIAKRRYREESAGVVVGGTRYASDRASQALVTGAVVAARAAQDAGEAFSIQWKCPDGWATLDATTMIAAGQAIRSHVQACFDREAALLATVDGESYTDDQLGTGWPEG